MRTFYTPLDSGCSYWTEIMNPRRTYIVYVVNLCTFLPLIKGNLLTVSEFLEINFASLMLTSLVWPVTTWRHNDDMMRLGSHHVMQMCSLFVKIKNHITLSKQNKITMRDIHNFVWYILAFRASFKRQIRVLNSRLACKILTNGRYFPTNWKNS